MITRIAVSAEPLSVTRPMCQVFVGHQMLMWSTALVMLMWDMGMEVIVSDKPMAYAALSMLMYWSVPAAGSP